MNRSIRKFIVSILMCQMVGIIGAVITMPAITTWYVGLIKPAFNPPSWIFGPVWTLLYLMIGISFFLIWNKKTKIETKQNAFIVFFIQLFLNAIWSPIFFGLKSPLVALLVIVALWISILLTIINFNKISKLASYLLIPYLLWVSFATVLNFSIWQLN